jgi:hypothetical protein
MSTAALTPRVRTIVICDDVSASLTEEGVFTLEGVRYHLTASSFPLRWGLNLFLLLSSPRKGRYSGRVLLVNEQTDKTIRYLKLVATFEDDNDLSVVYLDLGDCVFPQSGRYRFEIYFSGRDAREALKGEQPFAVLSVE